MKRMVLVAALNLAGCNTTVVEIRRDLPRAAYQSKLSAPALEQCLAGALSWLAPPSVIHGETSTEIAFGSTSGGTALLVTLIPTSSGTSVEVREKLTYGARVRRNVETCVEVRA